MNQKSGKVKGCLIAILIVLIIIISCFLFLFNYLILKKNLFVNFYLNVRFNKITELSLIIV